MDSLIARLFGPTVVYLFFAGYFFTCLFGPTLDDLHERWTNSRFDFFMLPWKLKDRDFYIRFYKVISGLVLLLATVVYVLVVTATLSGWRG